jgi:hypothetical protein
MTNRTVIDHEIPLGARIRAPYVGGLEGTVIAVAKDADGGTSYTVSAWSIRAEVFARHIIFEHELKGFKVLDEAEKP